MCYTKNEQLAIIEQYIDLNENDVFKFICEANSKGCYNTISSHKAVCGMMGCMNQMYKRRHFLKEEMLHDEPQVESVSSYYNDHSKLSRMEAEKWVHKMLMHDGTHGAKWSIAETTAVAKEHNVEFTHITDYEWWVAMNMAYSDFYYSAKMVNKHENPLYYVGVAKGILFDDDGANPHKKLYVWLHEFSNK